MTTFFQECTFVVPYDVLGSHNLTSQKCRKDQSVSVNSPFSWGSNCTIWLGAFFGYINCGRFLKVFFQIM